MHNDSISVVKKYHPTSINVSYFLPAYRNRMHYFSEVKESFPMNVKYFQKMLNSVCYQEILSSVDKSPPPIYLSVPVPRVAEEKFNIRRVSTTPDGWTAAGQIHCPTITFPGEI